VTSIEIVVRGRLADSLTSLIASRFSALTVSPREVGTRLSGEMDQSTERALLALLWDTGHDVISMQSTPHENGVDDE
jgi:hypothetical protein